MNVIMKRITKLLVLALMMVAMLTVTTTKVKADGEGTTVYFYNSLNWDKVCVYSWSENSNAPKKTEMEQTDKKGWYKFTFDSSMGEIKCLFYNGEWGEMNQTEDITIESGTEEMYFYAKEEKGSDPDSTGSKAEGFKNREDCVASYKAYKKEAESLEAEKKDIKIYFRNDKEWKEVYLWAWTEAGRNVFSGQFPGEKMKKFDDNWYEYDVKTDEAIKFIFSDGNGDQTGDSEVIQPGGTYWITIATKSEVESNADGLGAGYRSAIYKEPQPGWPGGRALTEEEIESSKAASQIGTRKQTKKNNKGAAVMWVVGIIGIAVVGVLVNKNHKKNTRIS